MAANAATLLLALLILASIWSAAPTAEDQGSAARAGEDGAPQLPGIADGDDGDIVDLSDAAFDDALLQREYVLALLYNSSCERSKRYMVQLRRAAAGLKAAGEAVLVGKVDAGRHALVRRRAEAEGTAGDGEVPLYLWAERGRLQACDEFSSDDIVAWVTRKAGSSVTTIHMDPSSPSRLPTLSSLLKDSSATALALALVHDMQGPAAAAFKDASKDVDGVRFALTMHAAVAAALGWQGDAAAALARTGREEAVVAVLKRQQDAFVPHEGPFTREAVAAFVRKNRLPLFVHFDDDAVEQFGKHTKWHIVIFCPRAAFSHFEQSLAPLARQHKGKVHFALVDSSDEDASGIPMDYFGVRVDETAVIAVFTDTTQGEPQESKHRLTEDPTPANMQAFITAFLAGELPPYYKSDPVPAKNDGVVRTVVGRTFDDIVMDEARDVMLMLSYGDECPSCEALLPCFTRLALRLSAVPPLLFAHMDFASNEVPGLELEAFPTVLLYRAHNKSHPVAVQDRLVRWRHMVRTLREHGGTALPEGLEEEVQEEGAEYEAARREEAAQAAAEVKDEL
ncbi:hypothetical protein CLOM_g16710 [Closterium sp. NIES-68]|nr:hypothetical protein CLOM_g16710 [Closterium sp. NIES-68]GJP82833.1 hypothetical protein CLOP_g13060 [Closterium sp. NIES-67]